MITASSHMSENFSTQMRLIAKISFCLFDLLVYVPVNSCGHAGMLAVEKNIKQYIKIPVCNKTQVYLSLG